jgi:hypothetical protein
MFSLSFVNISLSNPIANVSNHSNCDLSNKFSIKLQSKSKQITQILLVSFMNEIKKSFNHLCNIRL